MAAINPLRSLRTFTNWLDVSQQRIAHIYDTVYSHKNCKSLEHMIVYLAAIGFLLHLLLIFLARTLPAMSNLTLVIGSNYLAAISTPFSLILFYEVLLMVLSLPDSTTRSVGTQFEIISLIILRNVFKDMAKLEDLEQIDQHLDAFRAILVDMGGGVLLFLLVTVFYHISRRRTTYEQTMRVQTESLVRFINRKKILSLLLSILLFGLAANSLMRWGMAGYLALLGANPLESLPTNNFYTDMFSVLIFTDVLILILSLLLSDNYELVFRNAGFVIATILLRISLSISRPYNVGLALVAVLFGILVLLIYKYHSHIGLEAGVDHAEEESLP